LGITTNPLHLRKEAQYGKIIRSNEDRFGAKKLQPENHYLLFGLHGAFCPSLWSLTGGDGGRRDSELPLLFMKEKKPVPLPLFLFSIQCR
jgi:hypothetical protein